MMASRAALARQVSHITKCPICMEDFNNPRSLPCLHSLCLRCIHGLCRANQPGTSANCPMCRKKFTIPPDGPGGFPVNFFLQELIETKRASDICEVCSTDQNLVQATSFCNNCSQKLCERCSWPHKKMKGGPHDVRPLSAESKVEPKEQRTSYCTTHPDKPLELYCFDCSGNVCLTCFMDTHRQHRCEELEKVARDFRAFLVANKVELNTAGNWKAHVRVYTSTNAVQCRKLHF